MIEVVYVGKIIMILFLTMSSCQRQVSCHKGDIEIIDVLNRNHPIEINLYDIVDSVKYVPLGTGECLLSEIECIIKIRWIFSLIVLQDRFCFIQCLYQMCFRDGAVVVFVPQGKKF